MIKIKDKEYKLKYTVRSLFIYEQIMDKPFKFEGLYNEYLLFFCILIASNQDFDLTFDEFINECDEDLSLFTQFREWLIKELEKQSIYTNKEETKDDTDSKKKN